MPQVNNNLFAQKKTMHDVDDVEDKRFHFHLRSKGNLTRDIRKIIDLAIKRLRGKITYEPVGFELLDKEFPFSDLESFINAA